MQCYLYYSKTLLSIRTNQEMALLFQHADLIEFNYGRIMSFPPVKNTFEMLSQRKQLRSIQLKLTDYWTREEAA